MSWRDLWGVIWRALLGLMLFAMLMVPIEYLLEKRLWFPSNPWPWVRAGAFYLVSWLAGFFLSGRLILHFSPKHGRAGTATLLAVAFWTALGLVTANGFAKWVFSRRLIEATEWLFLILPVAWCLTWARDAVRRGRTAG